MMYVTCKNIYALFYAKSLKVCGPDYYYDRENIYAK